MIQCPYHDDSNPSCSVSPRKNGCFYCFGCEAKGSFVDLMAEITQVTKADAIQQTAAALGQTVEYHQPDANAVAIYDYRDKYGKLLKQVLRYPDESGTKVFKQRQPANGGWKWKTQGLPPMLFNADKLLMAGTVCVTEGEKDAQSVTDLHLHSSGGEVLGVTKWRFRFMGCFSGKAVGWLSSGSDARCRRGR